MTEPVGKPGKPNWVSGLIRIGIIIYGVWVVSYLLWSGFLEDVARWFGTNDSGVKRAVGLRIQDDLTVALLWPLVVAFGLWVIFTMALPLLVWIVFRGVKWVADGFNKKPGQS